VLPGSQSAIQTLPRLFPPHRVAVLAPSYAEHAYAWKLAGHNVEEMSAGQLEVCAERCQTLVLCNPNNPDATVIPKERLLHLAHSVDRLIVDEAFIDPAPEDALTPLAGTDAVPNLIVLRSLGKFFGLAGARVGFAFARRSVLEPLAEALGPWAVTGPSREVATAALMDTKWQAQARIELGNGSKRLTKLLMPLATLTQSNIRSQLLFVYMACTNATLLADFFATHGILIRYFDNAVRFGLPKTESEWHRLESVVQLYCQRSTVNTSFNGTR
jgi:cobalamin biosynthetic protein CobC